MPAARRKRRPTIKPVITGRTLDRHGIPTRIDYDPNDFIHHAYVDDICVAFAARNYADAENAIDAQVLKLLAERADAQPDPYDDALFCDICCAPCDGSRRGAACDDSGPYEAVYCAEHWHSDDEPTPEQQAQRDAENAADMLDFLHSAGGA